MPLCVHCHTAEAEFHTPDERAVCSAICASRLLGVPQSSVSVETVNALFGQKKHKAPLTDRRIRKLLTALGDSRSGRPSESIQFMLAIKLAQRGDVLETFNQGFARPLAANIRAFAQAMQPPLGQGRLVNVQHVTAQLINLYDQWLLGGKMREQSLKVRMFAQVIFDMSHQFPRGEMLVNELVTILERGARIQGGHPGAIRSELEIGVNLEDQITTAERAVKTLQDRLSQTEDRERDAWNKLKAKKEHLDQEYAIHVEPLDDQVATMRTTWSDLLVFGLGMILERGARIQGGHPGAIHSELEIGVNLEDQITAAERAVKTSQDRLSQTEDSERDAWNKLQAKREQRDQEYAIHVKPLDDQVDATRTTWSDFTKNKSAIQREVYSAESKAQKLREKLKARPGSAEAAGAVKTSPPITTMTAPSTMAVDLTLPKEDDDNKSGSGDDASSSSSASSSSDFGPEDQRHEDWWFKSKHRKILPAIYRQKDHLLQALASEVINMIEQKSAKSDNPDAYRERYGAFVYTINLYWAVVTEAPQSNIVQPTFSRQNALTYLFNPLSYDSSPAAPHRAYHSQQMIQSLVDAEATDLFGLSIRPVVAFRQDAYRQLPFNEVVKKLYEVLKARFTSKEKILKVMNDVLFMVVASYLTENTSNEEVVELVVRKHKLIVPNIDDEEPVKDEDDDDDSSSSSAADSFKSRRKFLESEQYRIVTMLIKSSRNVLWRVAELAAQQMILDSARTDEKIKKRGAVLAQAMLYLTQMRDKENTEEYYPPVNFRPQDARTELFNPTDSDLDQATEGSYAEAVEETINAAEYAYTASDFFHHSFANLMTFEGGNAKTKEFRALVARTKLSVRADQFDRAVDGSAFVVTAFYLANIENNRLPTIKSILLHEHSAAAAASSQ